MSSTCGGIRARTARLNGTSSMAIRGGARADPFRRERRCSAMAGVFRPPPRQRRSQASVPDWVWSNKTPLGPGGPAGFFCARRFWMVPSCLVNSKHAYSFRKIATLLIENAARLACIISSVTEKLSASFLTLRVAELLRVDDPRDDTDVPGLELIAREPLPQSLLRRTIPPLG